MYSHSGHGVIALAAPGVAAAYAPQGQTGAPPQPVALQGLCGIFTAGGGKAARGRL